MIPSFFFNQLLFLSSSFIEHFRQVEGKHACFSTTFLIGKLLPQLRGLSILIFNPLCYKLLLPLIAFACHCVEKHLAIFHWSENLFHTFSSFFMVSYLSHATKLETAAAAELGVLRADFVLAEKHIYVRVQKCNHTIELGLCK